jgi:hypothetical protein
MPTTLVSTGVQFPDNSVQTTAASGSFILLGTLNTTSGTSQVLSGLNLNPYEYLYIAIAGVSFNNTGNLRLAAFRLAPSQAGNIVISGWATLSLRGYGTYESITQTTTGFESVFNTFTNGYIGSNGITRSSTSLSFDGGGSASFDAGQIQVYGVK